MRLEDLGVIGNCQISALVERSGNIIWCCLPRFDSEPTFGALLDPDGGSFAVSAADGTRGEQRYLENTNVLETTFACSDGTFRVIDFAPRYFAHDRMYRPTQLVRIVEPVAGTPRVTVHCDPRLGWSKTRPAVLRGSNHVAFDGFASPLRLVSDIPPTFLEGSAFPLTERRHLVLAMGAPVEESLAGLCDHALGATVRYWRRWVKHCNIPPLYQKEVVRSALVLKLHCFEDTGAIIAAMTTSIPEAPGSGRTWDYRYCWLRDAFYTLSAFRLIGHFEERERFITFLLNIAESTPELALAPLYRVDGRSDVEERILGDWRGFDGDGPVRTGNAAALHQQHDVFGEMVLALVPVFLDQRFKQEQSANALQLLERLTRKAIRVAGTPDAGIWEYRTAWTPQTFSSLMCWAAADRMALVADQHMPSHAGEFRAAAAVIREQILAQAWNPQLNCFTGAYGGSDLDASLLQMATLRLLPGDDPRLHATIDAIWQGLSHRDWLLRYRLDDGFGRPQVAFILCTLWLVEALAVVGRDTEARQVMARVHAALSPLGLLSEDYEATTLRMWGNFPQAYSHVGLIHAAFAASPRWSEIL
jgi:GH15 family glucan-1,4-alpha-glucosidase